jgi:vancomycin resistance protein YoaR
MLVAGLCLLAGSALGLLVVPRSPSPGEFHSPEPELIYLGSPLPKTEDAARDGQRKARDFLSRSFNLVLPDGKMEVLPLSKWGASVDEKRLKRLIVDFGDPSSPTRRLLSETQEKSGTDNNEPPSPVHLPSAVSLEPQQAISELMRIKDRIDLQPLDARVDIKTGVVRPHRDGLWLDVDATFAAIENALSVGELRAKAVGVERSPARHAQDLRDLQFPSVLGHFETSYSRAQQVADRTYNLRLAATRLDGTVVMPGEIFDFNAVVGPRDEASGYKVATVIEDGELVDGIGGGTCQISGTLHGAVFFAGLEIIERYPHTRPSSYIKMGMDATVVYPTINFRFRNSFDFPVVVHQTVDDGIVRAEIRGKDQDQVVTLIRKVDEAIRYEQVERQDPTLPQGNNVLAQRGMPGFRLHRYRTIRRGSHTEREKWRDVYPPTNQVIRVGTGPNNLERRASVGTPEYQADEVLIITQRRPVDGQPGILAENREQGRYGAPGWTREAGMPFWEDR